MKVKLDENLPAALVDDLAALGHDAQTVVQEGLKGRPDDQVAGAARREDRFLVSQDLDFSDVRKFAPGTHPGLLLVRLKRPGREALRHRVRMLIAGIFVLLPAGFGTLFFILDLVPQSGMRSSGCGVGFVVGVAISGTLDVWFRAEDRWARRRALRKARSRMLRASLALAGSETRGCGSAAAPCRRNLPGHNELQRPAR